MMLGCTAPTATLASFFLQTSQTDAVHSRGKIGGAATLGHGSWILWHAGVATTSNSGRRNIVINGKLDHPRSPLAGVPGSDAINVLPVTVMVIAGGPLPNWAASLVAASRI